MSPARMSCDSPIACRYLNYRLPNGRWIVLPLIQVELVSEKERFTTPGLLDSGSTHTFIPLEMANILEIIPENRRSNPVETAGGSADFFQTKIKNLSLLAGGRIFSDFPEIGVLVPNDPERDLPYVILGRDSVFKRFHIMFKENIRKFVIQHHSLASQRRP